MLQQFLVGNLEVFRKNHIITTLCSKVKIRKRKKKKEISKIKKSHRLIFVNLFSGSKKPVANKEIKVSIWSILKKICKSLKMNEQRWLPIESNPQVILPKSFMLQDLSNFFYKCVLHTQFKTRIWSIFLQLVVRVAIVSIEAILKN